MNVTEPRPRAVYWIISGSPALKRTPGFVAWLQIYG